MKTKFKTAVLYAAASLTLGMSVGAQAADIMYSRLNGAAIYDATSNLTWVSNANLAATNTFGVSGINSAGYMSFATANNWIAAMNAANYLGYNNWALPITLQPDATCSLQNGGISFGYNCTGSQMGNLFYNALGGVSGQSIANTHNANYNLFSNFQTIYYRSGTVLAPSVSSFIFYFNSGWQTTFLTYGTTYALAVRSGDVIAAVPEPTESALMISGLGLIGFIASRRKKPV